MLLAFAAAAAAATASPAATYRALGTEPFWSLTIGSKTMRFEPADGRTVSVRTPSPRAFLNGRRYVARGLTVFVQHARCSDGMSDAVYPDRVTVRIGGRTLRGCGGAPASASRLEGRAWAIVAVNGVAPDALRFPTLRLADGQLSGNAGCNSLGGRYRMEGERLIVGRVVSTRIMCPGPGMATERAVLAVLAQPASVTWRGERVVLANAAGSLTLAER